MFKDYLSKSDSDLIEIFLSNPENPNAKIAKEILEYRKYLAFKDQNKKLLILTIVLAASAVLTFLYDIMKCFF
jgi:hypothetical protein